jgi:hypothetical protein
MVFRRKLRANPMKCADELLLFSHVPNARLSRWPIFGKYSRA